MSKKFLLLSTVTPVYRGEEYLREVVQQLKELKDRFISEGWPITLAESIFVDDGSIDLSKEVLSKLQQEQPWIKVIYLSRNFGQHQATVAGILHSSGDWIATLDEDLQHRPQHLIAMLRELIKNSADVLYANPIVPVHGSWLRDGASRTYKFLLSHLSGNPMVRRFNSFRLLRGTIGRAAAAVSSYDTYFDVALGWFTSSVADLPLPLTDDRYMKGGKSGYGWRQLIRHARRMLVTSQVKILRLGTLAGLLSLVFSAVVVMSVLVTKFFYPESIRVEGWAALSTEILFFGGLSCFLLGVCLEYMTVLVHNAQGRPTFLTVDRSQDVILREWFASH